MRPRSWADGPYSPPYFTVITVFARLSAPSVRRKRTLGRGDRALARLTCAVRTLSGNPSPSGQSRTAKSPPWLGQGGPDAQASRGRVTTGPRPKTTWHCAEPSLAHLGAGAPCPPNVRWEDAREDGRRRKFIICEYQIFAKSERSYIRSGVEMPSRSRVSSSCFRTTWQRARREARVGASGA